MKIGTLTGDDVALIYALTVAGLLILLGMLLSFYVWLRDRR